ncbi:Cupin 1 [Dillenia turbinata]|uniref:Cupin 1 n=1 Tax=Dillenia turbinata TaxID=194707 RepID=A0AAN8Z9Q2_9MAGN
MKKLPQFSFLCTIPPSWFCDGECTQSSEDIYPIETDEEEECLRECHQGEVKECQAWCDQEHSEEQEQEQVGGVKEREEEEEERNNPFYNSRGTSESLSRYEEGWARPLPRFTEILELFRHLESYWFKVCKANTRSFIIPHHFDVETIFFVSQGRGTVTLVKQNLRESYKVEKGDVMMVDAGTTVYTISHDKNEKLQMVKLVQSRNAPGDCEVKILSPSTESSGVKSLKLLSM